MRMAKLFPDLRYSGAQLVPAVGIMIFGAPCGVSASHQNTRCHPLVGSTPDTISGGAVTLKEP
jgi:hypothetical protein